MRYQALPGNEYNHLGLLYNLLVCVKNRPGKFIIKGSYLARLLPGERVDRELTQLINDAFIVGKERTEYQDAEFPINQLVKIALRAISPGINDPFTAIRCIDRFSAGLSRIAQRDFSSPYRYGGEDNLRVIVEVATFEGLVNSAFNQIRQYGYTDVAVTIRLWEAIAKIAPYTRSNKDRALLLRHAGLIQTGRQFGKNNRGMRSRLYYPALRSSHQSFKARLIVCPIDPPRPRYYGRSTGHDVRPKGNLINF